MNSHVPAVSSWLFASPLSEGERTEVRGLFMLTIKSPNPHPTLSLAEREGRGEYIALTT